MSAVKGSTQVALRWNYTLSPGSNLLLTTFYIIDDGNSDAIGTLSPNNIAAVNDINDYRTRFDISISEVATLIIKKVTEREEAVYQCKLTVVGNTWTYEIRVIVLDPAKIVKLVSEHEVAAQQSVSLDCQAEGNPKPTYTWTPCDPQQSVCQKSVLHFQASDKSVHAFTCKVENNLGSDKRNTFLCKLVRTKLLTYKWLSIFNDH